MPKVKTEIIAGKDVRLAEIKVSIDDAEGQTAVVQVAETTNVRSHFQERMLLSLAVPQLLVIAFGLFAVWYGITKILTPLGLLQKQLENRSKFDLSELSDHKTPQEVYPLVRTLNHLLSRLKEELDSHQRFIANAAHQLRTPLAGLKTYSSIGSEMTDAKELQNIVYQLDQGIDRAGRIVSQLLALARTDGTDIGRPREKNLIDLNFLVSDVVSELVEQAIRKNINLEFDPADSPADLKCEHSAIRDLAANLIENALIYTPRAGSVKVKIRKEENIELSVLDTGPGIAEAEREKVFERFYRIVGTSGKGSGLGLSIVKEVANMHSAVVRIESGPDDKGTTVIVQFPQTT